VPALHRACLHQRDQPDTNNSGRCFTFLPIENGHDSDTADAEWAVIEPHLPPPAKCGRTRETALREVVNAIFYIAQTGCQWRLLPKDFPPYSTV
jgi:hypothetical protein